MVSSALFGQQKSMKLGTFWSTGLVQGRPFLAPGSRHQHELGASSAKLSGASLGSPGLVISHVYRTPRAVYHGHRPGVKLFKRSHAMPLCLLITLIYNIYIYTY